MRRFSMPTPKTRITANQDYAFMKLLTVKTSERAILYVAATIAHISYDYPNRLNFVQAASPARRYLAVIDGHHLRFGAAIGNGIRRKR
jgi:hypothetical protein